MQASGEVAGTSASSMGSSIQSTMFVICPNETWLYRRQADPKTLHACQNTPWAVEDLTKETALCTAGKHDSQACCDARPSRITLTHRESESHGIVRRLPEVASSWRVRVAPPGIEQWRELVAPPELMGGSSRAVMSSKQTFQILEQIGTGAEVRTTSDSIASREACTGTGSGERRYLSIKEPWIQEARRKNESQVVSEDTILNRADIGTEVHTSERLTMLLRQIPPRRGEERSRRWYVPP